MQLYDLFLSDIGTVPFLAFSKKNKGSFFFFNQKKKKKVRFLAFATGQKMITRAVEHHGSVVIDFAVVEVHRETS